MYFDVVQAQTSVSSVSAGSTSCVSLQVATLCPLMLTVAGNDRLECRTRGFRVTDTRGTVLFSADKNEVVVGAEVLKVTGQPFHLFSDDCAVTCSVCTKTHQILSLYSYIPFVPRLARKCKFDYTFIRKRQI